VKVRTRKSRGVARDFAFVTVFFAFIIPAHILSGVHPVAIVAFFAATTLAVWVGFNEIAKLRETPWQFSMRAMLLAMTCAAVALGVFSLIRK
jgi:hypothetical protein